MFVRTQVVSCFIVLLLLPSVTLFFFFNDTATTEIYTLSLHDALPISPSDDRVHDHPLRPIQDVDLAIREGGHVQLGVVGRYGDVEGVAHLAEIGRASCRERV